MANNDNAHAPSEPKLKHYDHYSAKVTDKESKQLCLEGHKLMAKQTLSNNKDTFDIHVYKVIGTNPENFVADSKSPSILKKLMEDAGSQFVLKKFLGDLELLSELKNILDGSESLAMSGGSASQSALATLASWNQLRKLPVALNFTGTNLYLAVGEQSSLTLEEKPTKELEEISGSNNRFIFWQGIDLSMKSFESSMHKDFYICTKAGASNSPVELRTGPEHQQAISEFLVSE